MKESDYAPGCGADWSRRHVSNGFDLNHVLQHYRGDLPRFEHVLRFNAWKKTCGDVEAARVADLPVATFRTWRRKARLPSKRQWGGRRNGAGRKPSEALA